MKTPRYFYGALAVFCAAVLVIGTAGAAAMTQQGTAHNSRDKAGQFDLTKMLDNLTAKGYDVSAISAAVISGDYKTVFTLMQQFRTAHPDAFPAHAAGAGTGQMTCQVMSERMTRMLTNLTAKGYDVSAIQTAVTSGDYRNASTLLQQFRTAHPDAFPAHVAGTFKGRMTGQAMGESMTRMLTNLTANGYDVSAIQTAVTSGDYRNASTLLQQFRTAHPDAFPAHVTGTFKGRMTGQAMGESMTRMLTNLTANGYDVSAIQTAVTSGDYRNASTLLQQFRTAHPDAFPAHAAEAGTGHPGWHGRTPTNQ